MKRKTAYNHYKKAKSKISSLINPFRWETFEKYLQEQTKIYNSISHCPYWVKERISECISITWDFMHRYEIEWVTEWKGDFFKSWNSFPEDLKEYIKKNTNHTLSYYRWTKNKRKI